MPFLLQKLIKYISHVTLWSKSLKEFLPNKITHVKYKQDQMTNFDMELYFKIRKASKDKTNLPVGKFITKTNLNRQANQRRFKQKFFEEAYKDRIINKTEDISKKSIQSLISFFVDSNSKDSIPKKYEKYKKPRK